MTFFISSEYCNSLVTVVWRFLANLCSEVSYRIICLNNMFCLVKEGRKLFMRCRMSMMKFEEIYDES